MWIINCFFILCLMAIVTGCVKDPIIPPVEESHTGGLAFRVMNDHGIPIQGVTISISLSQENLRDGIYIATEYTDSNGKADFGLLNEGIYHYRADFINNDISFHVEGVVEVKPDVNITQEVQL